VDGTGGGQNTQTAWLVSTRGSTPCLGSLKLPLACWFPAVERAPRLLLHLGPWRCAEEVCGSRSPVSLHMNLPSYKNTKTIFTNLGSRDFFLPVPADLCTRKHGISPGSLFLVSSDGDAVMAKGAACCDLSKGKMLKNVSSSGLYP